MSVFIAGISTGSEIFNNNCKEKIIIASLIKKHLLKPFNSDIVSGCRYHALVAKRYAKLMSLKSTECCCANNYILKTYLHIKKAEQKTDLIYCKEEMNIALEWLDKSVNTLTTCKTN